MDISKVLAAAKEAEQDTSTAEQEGEVEEKDEDAPVFSLVDGTYKTRRMFGNGETASNGQVSVCCVYHGVLTLHRPP